MDVLEDMSTGQINLASAAARKTVANTIVAAIKTNKKGWFLDLSSDKYGKPKLTEEELETQRYKEYWTCDICGKDTSGVDYDYIGSGTNHLGCELKSQEEIDEYIEDIDEQAYAQGRGSSKDVRREKNWLQKKHEDKVFGHDMGGTYELEDGHRKYPYNSFVRSKEDLQKQAYVEMTSDGLPEGGDAQAVLESHKLAEEIVEAQEGTWIYESPDGGKTVFRRPFSDYDAKNKEEIDWETKEPTGRKFTEYPFKVNRGLDRRRKEKVVTFSLGTDDE